MLTDYVFRAMLDTEIRSLTKLHRKVEKNLSKTPEGSMHVLNAKKRKSPMYYQYVPGKKLKYLGRKDTRIIHALAQKGFDSDMLEVVSTRLYHAKLLRGDYDQTFQEMYDSQDDERKKLVYSLAVSDQDFIKEWYEKIPDRTNSMPMEASILTNNNEYVRSKSEKILADEFNRRGIPYRYEPRITLRSGQVLHPDFALLNVHTRETIYLEHLGMIDSPEYAVRALEKLRWYQESGYILGKNLIITFETQNAPLNKKQIDQLIEEYLL